MTFSDIVQRKQGGEHRVLALALVNLHLNIKPTAHIHECGGRASGSACISCVLTIGLEGLVLDGKRPWVTWSPELFVDLAAMLVQRGWDFSIARLYTAFIIPTAINHLMPRRFRWVYVGPTGRTMSPLRSEQQRAMSRQLAAAGLVDPFWDEPIVLPQSVRLSREASASHSIWPPRNVPSPAELVPVFGGAA